MKERNLLLRRCLIASALLLGQNAAFATITGAASANGDGTYTYSYTVDNSGGAFDIAAWSLEFGFLTPDWNQADAPTGDVQVPNSGWGAAAGIPVTGLSAQDFFTLSSNDDIKVNSTLNGFSFRSSFAPGTVSFTEFAEGTGDAISGSVIGPATMTATLPESGSSFSLTALGAAAALGLHQRPRARRTS